jgi:hypothetical protein
MQDQKDQFEYYEKVAETLDEGGLTKHPIVLKACQQFYDYGYIKPLQDLIQKFPQILTIAKRNVLEQKEFPFWPPPYKKREIEKLKGKYDLGIINNQGDKVYLSPEDFTKGLTIFGEIGSGKSYPVLRLLKQILKEPIEKRGFNLIIIQASKNDADFLIKYNSELLALDWKDIRRSPFEVEEWDTKEAKINSFCSIYSANNWLMAYGQPLFKNTVNLCMNKFGKDTDFHKLFDFIDISAEYLGIQGPEHRNLRDKLRSTLFSFRETEKVLNCKNGFTTKDFFTKRDIILNIQPWQQPSDYVIATFLSDLFKDIQRYYQFNPDNRKLRTLIVIDECRRIFPASKDNNTGHQANAPMIDFVTTRRSSRIGVVAITQEPQSAPDWLIMNSAYILSMIISGTGRKHIKDILNITKEEASFMDKLPKFGTGIMRYRGFDKRFLVKIPDDINGIPFDDTPIPPNEVREMMKDKISKLHKPIDEAFNQEIQNLKDKRAKEREKENQKKQAIIKFSLKEEKKRIENKQNAINIIEHLIINPFIPYTELSDMLKISRNKFKKAVELLNKDQLAVTLEKVKGPKGADTQYIALTENVNELLNRKEKIVSPAHFKHSLYKDRVDSFLKFKGFKTVVEYPDETRRAFIDVLAIEPKTEQRIAYEITLSFSNLKTNIQECLSMFNIEMGNIHIVTEKKEDKTKAMNITIKAFPSSIGVIKFDLINDFLIKN